MAIFAMAQNGTFAFCARRRVSTGRGSATDGAGAPCASLTGAAVGVGLHKLKSDRKAQWAMTVIGPWPICFRFSPGDADDVVDYRKG